MQTMAQMLTGFCIGYTVGKAMQWLYLRWEKHNANKRYKAFQAGCQARLAEMYAVKRDPYDGRPI